MKNNQRLKVGLVFDDSLDSNDGVAQHVKTLGAWLSDQGHSVRYLVGETKMNSWHGGKVYSLARNQTVSFNRNKLSIPLLSRKSKIKQVLYENQLDIIHIMMPYSPLMAQRVINLAEPRTAVIGTFHIYPAGSLSKLGTSTLRAFYGKSLARFSSFISVSSAAAEFAKQNLKIDSEVIPNPINRTFYKTKKPAISSKKRIVFLGRLVKRKGCTELMMAFAELLKRQSDVELIIAGDGASKTKLANLAKDLKIESQTKFLGYIAEEEKPKLLASADIACFPSLYGESFGIVLVEAMAAGAKVVLGGDNPGYQTVLKSQPDMLIDPKNAKKFAERLNLLLNDNQLISKLHKWQDSQLIDYDIETVGPQIVKLYTQAIARLDEKSDNKVHG